MIGLLSARAPRLYRALKKITKKGGVVVLLEGTLGRHPRRIGKDDRRNYSGNTRLTVCCFLP